MAGPLDLVPANDRIVTSQAPTSSISPQQVASPYRELADNLNKIGEVTDTLATKAAETAGSQAVTRDADGALQVQRQPIIGPASEAFARAARLTYLAQTEPEIENKLAELRIKHPNDPVGFQGAAKVYGDEVLGKIADPTLRGPVQKIIDGNAGQHYRALLNQADQTNVQNTLVSLKSRISDAGNKLADLAFQGGTDTEEYKTLQGNVAAMYGELGGDARMGYPKARIDSELTEMSSQHKVMALSGQAIRMLDTDSPTARADAKKFLIDKIYGDPGLNLTMSQRHQAVTTAMGLMEARSAENKALIDGNKALASSVINGLHTNQPYNPIAVNDVIENARKIGDAETFYKAGWARTMHDFNDTVRGLPIPQQLAVKDGLQKFGPFAGQLMTSESSGNPAKVNQLGYAGLYQFGAPRLADLGIYTPGAAENLKDWSKTGKDAAGKWTGTFNVPGFPDVKTLSDFLGNPAAQQAAYAAHQGKMDAEIKTLGLDKYEGQTVDGVLINRNALYGMMHLGGAQGTADTLASGGANAARDANGTSVMDYAKRFGVSGAGTAFFNEAVNEQVKRVRNEWSARAPELVETAIRKLNTTGDLSDDEIKTYSTLFAETGRDDMREKLAVAVAGHYGVEQLDKLPESIRRSALVQGLPDAAKDNFAFKVHEYMRQQIEANAKAMTETPYSTYAVRTNAKPPPAYNFEDPQNVAAVAKSRAGTQAAIVANDRTGPMSVFEGKEAEAFGNVLSNGDAGVAAQSLAGLATLPDDIYQATLAQKPVAAAVSSMMGSKEPARMSAAMQAADKLWRTSPADAKEALGDAAITKMQAWQGLRGTFTPAEIAERINASDDPSTLKAREEAKTAAETEAKTLTPADMAYKLGTSWGIPIVSRVANLVTGATPSVPFDSIKGGELVADYRSTYTALRTYGVDADKASELAVKRLESTWGISAAAGNQVMKNPPERAYPAIGGSHDWLKSDLNTWVVKQAGPEFASTQRTLEAGFAGAGNTRNWSMEGMIADGQTQAEIAAGRPASYQVAIKKADGTLSILPSRIAFDPSNHIEEHGARLEQRRQSADFLRPGVNAGMPQPFMGATDWTPGIRKPESDQMDGLPRFEDFRRSDNIDDRRADYANLREQWEGMKTDIKNAILGKPELAEVPPSQLAKQLGLDDIKLGGEKDRPAVERLIEFVQNDLTRSGGIVKGALKELRGQ